MAENRAVEKNASTRNRAIVDIADSRRTTVAEKEEQIENEGKKRGKGMLIIFILIFALLIGGFAFFVFNFDLFGLRTEIFTVMHDLDPEYQAISVQAAAQKKSAAVVSSGALCTNRFMGSRLCFYL